ncbi:MAG: cation diffusion facilitator family transporter [Halofilum sp. (in: g-proteobacteria)]|nr:cation diffusion facilitator family transporter [Halofilum sp. (in: g-proteobacteria)]
MSAHGGHGVLGVDDADSRYRDTRRITWIGIGANLALAAVKIVAGVLGQSQGLVADGVHSISDLVSDAVVLLAARHAAREADADHPYGHGRIETAATVLVGIVLLATAAVFLGHNAVRSLAGPPAIADRPACVALAIALGSVAAKEALFRHTRRVARRIRSRLLEANAWHHRSDALSSVVVAVGIGGTLYGVATLDALAAIVVAVMVAKVGWDLVWQSLRELVDTGLDDASLDDLRREAHAVDGVKQVHTLRSRWMGHSALLDLHIQVGPRISVSEGHRIAEAVRLALLHRQARLGDVMVHVDPEEDTDGGPSNTLPLRTEVVGRLWRRWTGLAAMGRIESLTLHYLGGRVHLSVTLAPAPAGVDAAAEAEALRAAAAAEPEVGAVSVLERAAPI